MGIACYDPATGGLLGTYKSLLTIYNSLAALTATQQSNVWNDLTSGAPAKWSLDVGTYAGVVMAISCLAIDLASLFTAAQLLTMKLKMTTAYLIDNPQYLKNPSFDATINVVPYQ